MITSRRLANWMFLRLATHEDGQALVEYGLILFVIALVCLAALQLIGTNLNTILGQVAAAL